MTLPCVQRPLEHIYIGLARTTYIWCIHGIFGREITKYTAIYGLARTVCILCVYGLIGRKSLN